MNAMRREGLSGVWAIRGGQDLRDIRRQWETIGALVSALESGRLKANAEFQAQIDDPRVQLVGSVAVIPMCGPVFNRGNLFSYFFGGAVISTMRAQLRKAMADDDVKAIVFRVDSPGGVTDGVSEFAAEIFKARSVKPIIAVADTMCASAAYWLASSAEEIIASPSSFIGSIGVYWDHDVIARMLEAEGIDKEIVASSPEKVETHEAIPFSDEARAHWKGVIDQMTAMFSTDVARGRGITAKQVRDDYGKGRCFLAKEALKMGMVDKVETFEAAIQRLTGARRRGGATADATEIGDPQAEADRLTLDEPEPEPPAEAPEPAPVDDAAVIAAEYERFRVRAAARRRSLSLEKDHATV
jgi:signal peptide peptidase SppA